MDTLIALIGIVWLVWFWQQSLRARELAVGTAQELCARQNLQLLDSTVALNGIRLQRSAVGHLALQRTYQFEYSRDGAERRRGFVLLLGLRVETAGLAAD